jgi:hypothetical protein
MAVLSSSSSSSSPLSTTSPTNNDDGEAKQDLKSNKSSSKTSISSTATTDVSETSLSQVQPKKATHFGKADPKRDSLLFLGFLTCMFAISYWTHNSGIPNQEDHHDNNTKKRIPSLARVRHIQRSLERVLEETQKSGFAADTGCSIMLGSSSLPNAGWGLFAGRHYMVGDDILGGTQMMMRGDERPLEFDDIRWHPYNLLVKPHSMLHNAKWSFESPSSTTMTTNDDKMNSPSFPRLVATAHIIPGDEIFLSWDDHHLYQDFPNLFPTVPTPHHFQRADEIIQEARDIFQVNKAGGSVGVRKSRIPEINKGLKMVQRALFRYDATVARLLPSTVDDLLLYVDPTATSTSELISVKKRPLSSLVNTCRCFTNVQWRKSDSSLEDAEQAMASTNNEDTNIGGVYRPVLSRDYVPKGDLVLPVPLLLYRMNDDEDIVNIGKYAFNNEESAQVCSSNAVTTQKETATSKLPFSISTLCHRLKNSNGEMLGFGLCPLSNIVPTTTNPKEANAKYQWSAKSDRYQKFLSELLLQPTKITQDVIHKYMLSMSWDIVALRDIHQNETILVQLPVVDGDDPINNFLRFIHDDHNDVASS